MAAATQPSTLTPEELDGIRRRTTGSLIASQVFASGGISAGLTVASILAASMLGSSTWAGLPNSIRVLAAALASLPLSNYMARVGRRRGLVTGLLIGAAGAVLSVVSAIDGNFWLLLIGSAVFGAGYSANLLSRYAAADLAKPRQRGKAISLVVWGSTIGAVLGPNILGLAGGLANNLSLPTLSGPFLVAAVAFLLSGLVIWAMLRPDPLKLAKQLALSQTNVAAEAARPLRVILALPGVQLAFVTLMTAHMVMIAIMTMTPVYMHDNGHSLQVVGLVISGHVLGMYLFSPVTGWLSDRVGRVPVILMSVLSFVLAALANSLAPASSQILLGVGLFLLGLGWNFGFVSGSALLTDSIRPSERARLQGLADMAMGVAAAVSSVGSGLVLQTHGYATLNAYGASLVALPLIALWITRSRRRQAALATA